MYGFDFQRENAVGLGAVLHALLLASHYAKRNDKEFVLIEEGRKMPLLNGSVNDLEKASKDWHSYFKSLTFVPRAQVEAVWRECPQGWNSSPPDTHQGSRLEWYSRLIQEVYQLREDIKEEVEERIQDSGFSPEDTVLHIRRTDKTFPPRGTRRECTEVPLEIYFEEIRSREPPPSRIFLCTDDKSICEEVREALSPLTVVWDSTESTEHLHVLRRAGKLTKSQAWEENLNAIKNLEIMCRGKDLIGGRMSYLFRVAELLRYPKPTLNLRDSDLFGRAPYAEEDESFKGGRFTPLENEEDLAGDTIPREQGKQSENSGEDSGFTQSPKEITSPKRISSRFTEGRTQSPKDSFISLKSYPNFLNSFSETDWSRWREELNREGIISIPNFITLEAAREVERDLSKYPSRWWSHALFPSPDLQPKVLSIQERNPNLPYLAQFVEKKADQGRFAYHFKRTDNKHYSTCRCFSCRLRETFLELCQPLAEILGHSGLSLGESFASCYQRNHFLTMHADKRKGDYAFVLTLTSGWNPVHGGLLHFWDENRNEIVRTIIPKYRSLTLFRLPKDYDRNHFVSRVSGPMSRVSYSGWFWIHE